MTQNRKLENIVRAAFLAANPMLEEAPDGTSTCLRQVGTGSPHRCYHRHPDPAGHCWACGGNQPGHLHDHVKVFRFRKGRARVLISMPYMHKNWCDIEAETNAQLAGWGVEARHGGRRGWHGADTFGEDELIDLLAIARPESLKLVNLDYDRLHPVPKETPPGQGVPRSATVFRYGPQKRLEELLPLKLSPQFEAKTYRLREQQGINGANDIIERLPSLQEWQRWPLALLEACIRAGMEPEPSEAIDGAFTHGYPLSYVNARGNWAKLGGAEHVLRRDGHLKKAVFDRIRRRYDRFRFKSYTGSYGTTWAAPDGRVILAWGDRQGSTVLRKALTGRTPPVA